MKNVSFTSNSADNIHCVNAVFRMIYKYYFDEEFTWQEIDKLAHAIKGKATWTFIVEMELAKRGINVHNIESVDYLQLYKKGENYLKEIVGEESADYYLNKSNIKSVLKYIPQYLKVVNHETRKATINEIIAALKNNCLVAAEINSSILNNKQGFDLHLVLIYDYDGVNLILHDPGLPPIKSRRVTIDEFKKCFNYPGANCGITIFSK